MNTLAQQAAQFLSDWRGDSFLFGRDVLAQLPERLRPFGKRYYLVAGRHLSAGQKNQLAETLGAAGFEQVGASAGATPNSPDSDVIRVKNELAACASPIDFVICYGGGSLIDAAKASIVLHNLGGDCEDYFGVGLVAEELGRSGKKMLPMCAIITCSASAAHLTKYANVTNWETNQKKLIIDEAIVPDLAVFDYADSASMGREFTLIGGLDGYSHLTEVYWGMSEEDPQFKKIEKIVLTGAELIIENLPKAAENGADLAAREAIGLATDLGGMAIMVGSTNGPHLNSFSLVDVMDHGLGVGLLNPYYGYYFAAAITPKLRKLCKILQNAGYIDADVNIKNCEKVGELYADSFRKFTRSLGLPTTLKELPNYTAGHFERMLAAAKNPQLSSKLKAMPQPMTADSVDLEMAGILREAESGDLHQM